MQNIKSIVPALSALDPDSELAFRHYIVENSQRAIRATAFSFVLLMLLFCAVDISLGAAWLSLGNISRTTACFIIISFLLISLKRTIAQQKQGWLGITALSVLLLGFTFYDNARYFGKLGEGGPMLVSFAIVIIPIFQLLQKALLWLLLLSIVLFLKVCLQLETGWSVFYLSLTTFLCMIFQSQQDKLLRTQFKAVRLEQQKAETDQLTGLLNRRNFEQRLQQKLMQLTSGQHLSLGLLDIDYFKRYNDHYGHLDGDLVLVNIAKLLSANPQLMVVRFGGEEFILVEQHPSDALPEMIQLPQQLQRLSIKHQASPFSVVTASIGVITISQPDKILASGELLQQADKLLYDAKQQGRNQAIHHYLASST